MDEHIDGIIDSFPQKLKSTDIYTTPSGDKSFEHGNS